MILRLTNKIRLLTLNLLRNKNSLRVQTSISLILRISNRFTGFLITWWLANYLGPEELGIYSYAFSLIILLSVFAQFGLPDLVLREVSQGKAIAEWNRVKGMVIWALGLSFGLAIVAIVLSVLVIPNLPSIMENLNLSTFYIGLVMVPFLALNPILGGILRSLEKMIEGLLLQDTLKGLIFVLLLFTISIIGFSKALVDNYGTSAVMVLHSVAVVTTSLIGITLLLRIWPKDAKDVKPLFLTKSWRKLLIPFAALGGMFVLNNNVDILMLGALSNPTEVAYFKISMQLAVLVTFGLTAVRLAIAPRFSSDYAKKDFKKLKRSAQLGTRAAIFFAIPIGLIVVFGGRIIISTLFSKIYLAAYLPLIILIIAELANVVVGPVGLLLSMTGYERDTASTIFITLTINVLLNFILIPTWGSVGSAVATASAKIILNVILWFRVKQRFGFFLFPFERS